MKVDYSQCVLRAKKGDADAFAELYSLIYKDLYYIALSNLKNEDDACDVVSDAVLDAYTGIKNLKDEKAFKAWIIRILYIKIKKRQAQYIKEREHATVLTDEMQDMIPDKNKNYEEYEIIEQLKVLNENEKLVFSLSVISGYSSDEISAITGFNASTVRSHLFRGREKLKKHLSAQ